MEFLSCLCISISELKCPKCQKLHGLHDPTGQKTMAELASQLPTAAEYTKSLDRNQLSCNSTNAAKTIYCSEHGCMKEATGFCSTQCDYNVVNATRRLIHADQSTNDNPSRNSRNPKKQAMEDRQPSVWVHTQSS